MEGKKMKNLGYLYFDMDGVLCNFEKRANELLPGDSFNYIGDKEWKVLNQAKGFWSDLEWIPGAKGMIEKMKRYSPRILSAYTKSNPSVSQDGKMKWLAKNIPWIKKGNINLVVRRDKKLHAMTDGKVNILIDDVGGNIKEWNAAGGIGILHTEVRITMNTLKRLGY